MQAKPKSRAALAAAAPKSSARRNAAGAVDGASRGAVPKRRAQNDRCLSLKQVMENYRASIVSIYNSWFDMVLLKVWLAFGESRFHSMIFHVLIVYIYTILVSFGSFLVHRISRTWLRLSGS